MEEKVIFRAEVDEIYLKHRFDSLSVELLAVAHPLIRDEQVHIDDNENAVLPFDVYFEEFPFDKYTFETASGPRVVTARPLLDGRLVIGPALDIHIEGDPNDAPPIFRDAKIEKNKLILELLTSKFIIPLGEHPKAILEIMSRISRYVVKQGFWQHYMIEPAKELK